MRVWLEALSDHTIRSVPSLVACSAEATHLETSQQTLPDRWSKDEFSISSPSRAFAHGRDESLCVRASTVDNVLVWRRRRQYRCVVGSDESQDHVSTSFIRLAGPPRRRRAADPPLMAQPLHTFYSQVTSTVNNGPAEKPKGEISVFATVVKSGDKGSRCMCHDYRLRSISLVSATSFPEPKWLTLCMTLVWP